MFTQKRDFLCVWFLLAVFLFAAPVSAQTTPADDAHSLMSAGNTRHGSSILDLRSVPQEPQGPTGTDGNESGHRNAFDPTPSFALNDVVVHDDVTGQNSTSGVITKEVTKVGARPSSADSNLPLTLTVRTASLLELHAMRQSAVDLCMQLPIKYRTRLPQCADIFKHEIRLETLTKHSE